MGGFPGTPPSSWALKEKPPLPPSPLALFALGVPPWGSFPHTAAVARIGVKEGEEHRQGEENQENVMNGFSTMACFSKNDI